MDYIQEIIELSKIILKYESVYGHGGFSEEAVFGNTILDCQKAMLAYCRSIGMTTYLDPEGKYGYAQAGEGDDYIALLAHLDIVAPGDREQWAHPPFEPIILEDKLIARGAADDKVPAAIAVIAVKRLMDDNAIGKYPIRIIFGSDEETGFRCIKKYKQVHEPPKYTLVLDGTFPFSYSEKHLINYELHIDSDIRIQGGVGYNSVMDHVEWQNGDTTVTVEGKSAHASRPWMGENALVKMAYLNGDKDKLFEIVNDLAGTGGQHKLDFIEDEGLRSEITLNFGMVKDNVLYADLRVPPEMDLGVFLKDFEAFMERRDIQVVQADVMAGAHLDTESVFARTVLKCYQDITGDKEGQPYKTGSATYGRSFENNCLCFGPRMSYHITNTHKPNEFVTFDLIENAFEIYVHTLTTLEEDL